MMPKEDLAGYPFNAAALRTVCACYADGLVEAIEAVSLDFGPSDAHRNTIRSLIDKSLQKARRHLLYRRAVTVAAVIVILFSTIMATNVHARETVVHWLRQIFPEFVFYQFWGETLEESRQYIIGWIPNDFESVDYGKVEGEEYYVFANGEKGIIISFLDMGHLDELTLSGYTDYTLTDTTLNGCEAVIYQDNDSSKMDIVIFDTVHNVAICINSNMDLSTVLKIIESIKIE